MTDTEDLVKIINDAFLSGYYQCCRDKNITIRLIDLHVALDKFVQKHPILKTSDKDLDEYVREYLGRRPKISDMWDL